MRLLLSLRAQVCPGEWVYHKLSIDDALIPHEYRYGSSSAAGDA